MRTYTISFSASVLIQSRQHSCLEQAQRKLKNLYDLYLLTLLNSLLAYCHCNTAASLTITEEFMAKR